MGISIPQQLLTFGQSILLGLSVGILYDLLRPFRLRIPRLASFLDLLYCFMIALSGFLFLLRQGSGELRGFLVLGFSGGMLLFFCALAPLFRPLWDFWADILGLFFHILSIPLLFLKILCKKTVAAGKNLFYFFVKCYTIIRLGKNPVFQRRQREWHKKRKMPAAQDHTPVC